MPAKEFSCNLRTLGSQGRVLNRSMARSGNRQLTGGEGTGLKRQEAGMAVMGLLSYSWQCSLAQVEQAQRDFRKP